MDYTADKTILVNDVFLHYYTAGQGKPVVLVHGNGEDHHLFHTEIRRLLDAGYTVYAPDSRGHGANGPLDEYHYADMAEDMYQFICALGLVRPAYYGHSDGGIIGLLLELMHPGTLGAMAVSGTNLSPNGLLPSFLQKCEARNAVCPDPLVTLMLNEPHIEPQCLDAIRIPVLVTVGSNDLILPEETQRIAQHLPDVEQITLDGEDHGSYIRESEVMGKLLVSFLERRY